MMSNLDKFNEAIATRKKAEVLRKALVDSFPSENNSGYLFCCQTHLDAPKVSCFTIYDTDTSAEFEINPDTGAVSLIDAGKYADDIDAMQSIIEKWLKCTT